MRVSVAIVVLLAAVARAGGPGPAERLFVLGRCGGAPCAWDCESDQNPVCPAQEGVCTLPSERFAARVRIAIDDQQCEGAAGGRLTIALVGRKDDGSSFSIPDTTFDLCGVPEQDLLCGGSSGVCEAIEPRSTIFLCATFLPGNTGVIDETAVPDADWLGYSNFPPAVATALKAAFPGVAGEPIIDTATQRTFDDRVGDVLLPTVRELCVTGTFVEPSAALGAPSVWDGVPSTTATSSLAFGDCPTLPVVSTTSTTTAVTTTTLPAPCAALDAGATIVCLVDAGGAACATMPTAVAKKRDKAARLIGRAVAATRPRPRARRLAKAVATLERVRRRVARSTLDAACVAGLTSGLDAAIAYADALRQ